MADAGIHGLDMFRPRRRPVSSQPPRMPLTVSSTGLTSAEAAQRLAQVGPNRLREVNGNHPAVVLLRQIRSPMVLILLGAALLSAILREVAAAAMVVLIV